MLGRTAMGRDISQAVLALLVVATVFSRSDCLFNIMIAKRSCFNVTVDVRTVVIDVSHAIRVSLGANNTVNLFADVKWTVSNPKDVPLDGFVYHFYKAGTNRSKSLPPVSQCHAGRSHLWVKTNDKEVCDRNSSDLPGCYQDGDAFGDYCLCSQQNCSLLDYRCRGTQDLLSDFGDYQLSVLPTVRELTFAIDFHQDYTFYISPYYRENTILSSKAIESVLAVDDCAAVLEEGYSDIPLDLVGSLCCQSGARIVVAQNITIGESRPNFDTWTINKTVTWLPPAAGAKFLVHVYVINGTTAVTPKVTQDSFSALPGAAPADGTEVDNCSYSPAYVYSAELYDLLPNEQYKVQIISSFHDGSLSKWCAKGSRCTVTASVDVEDFDPCLAQYGYCDTQAECQNVPDPLTERPVTCSCGDGLEGDGVDPSFGDGCHDIDSCLSNATGCVPEAKCKDIPAPGIGVNCTCPDGYGGDGLESGSGCSSRAVTALAIALPLSVILILAVVVAVCVIRLREERKKKLLYNKYIVECNNGILMGYASENGNKEGPWEPTFGDKWEIDRGRLRVGDVIGRGNYGVVHLAWMSSERYAKEANAKNGEYRNGSFYDALSTSVDRDEYDEIDVGATVVAVKKLQESSRNHENLENFLNEIGFMLNLEHENIVRIYGCCSTEEPVYLVTEYLQYGDLLHFLWETREPTKGMTDPVYRVTEVSLCSMTRHVANGLVYLERERIIHGDIAARNILVGTNGICKISDFGLANDVYRYGAIKGHTERFVPYKWISPERMMSGELPITSRSDVWSFGNLMYEVFTLGCSPHPGVPAGELLDKLRSGYRMQCPKTCNTHVYNIMMKCWKWRPSARPGFNQVVKLLDTSIAQYQHSKRDVDVVTKTERLDKEKYALEVNLEMQPKENGHANGNIAFVENERVSQSRAM